MRRAEAAACAAIAALVMTAAMAAQGGGAAGPKKVTVIGCVKQSGGSLTITDFRGGPAPNFSLDPKDARLAPLHVGHEVELAGSIDASAGSKDAPRLKVDSVQWLSSTCWPEDKKK